MQLITSHDKKDCDGKTNAVAHARLPAANCRHSHAEVPRQCEADMSGKSVPHHEDTGELKIRRPASYRLYI